MYTSSQMNGFAAQNYSTHAVLVSQYPYRRRIFRKEGIHPLLKVALLALALCLSLAIGLVTLAAQAAEAPPVVPSTSIVDQSWPSADTIRLETNAGTMLRLASPATTVFVANPDIADIQLKSPRLLYIHGKAAGETTIYAMGRNEEVILNHRVTISHNLARLREIIGQVRPNTDIQVASLDDSVVLSGIVASAQEADDLRGLASQVLGETGTVINRLRISTPHQVNLRVRIAEVSRTISKQLGFDLGVTQTIGSLALNVATGSFITGAASGTTQVLGNLVSGNTNLNLLVDALDQNGLITLLAEPNLTAESGKAANFLVGGEFPIPVSDGDDGITVIFKQFGVGLSFVPVVMDDGQISMKILTEVSQLSQAGAVAINNISIPALNTRRAETTVNLGSGQSFAIAGLLQNTSNQGLDQFPGLGELPILGTLFRSTDFQKSESELVVIVTPYLVRPVSERIAGPTDQFQPASATNRVVFGEQNRTLPASPRQALLDSDGRRAPTGRAGFILR